MKIKGLALLSDEFLERKQKWWSSTESRAGCWSYFVFGAYVGRNWIFWLLIPIYTVDFYAHRRAAAYQAEIDARLDAWAVPYDYLEFCARAFKAAERKTLLPTKDQPWFEMTLQERIAMLYKAARELPDEDE